MKKKAKRTIKKNKVTGATLTPLTDVDELMLDFEGHESNYMVGLPLPDNAPGFSQPDGEDSNSSIADSLTGKCCKPVCFEELE